MVKAIKFICIAGIIALLALFVIFTGDARSANQKNVAKKGYNERIYPHKSNEINSKNKVNIDETSNVFNFIIRW